MSTQVASPPDQTAPIQEWNATRTDYPRDALVHELFREQVERTPDDVALSPEGAEDISYAELRRRVDHVAGLLQGAGAGPGEVVAVVIERSVAGYVALLAVLRSGAAYVPIDVQFPQERIERVVQDAGCRIAVTVAAHRDKVPEPLSVVDMDALPTDAPPPRDHEQPATAPAFIIYTSGSTGTPKGVTVTHRGIVRLVRSPGLLAFGPDDVMCGTVNLTFDLSLLDVFAPLLNGGRLCVPAQETLLSPAALEAMLQGEGATWMWLGAALFHQMAAARPAMFRTLRCLLAGGDALNPSAVRAVLEHGPPERFIDAYGPAENSVLTTAHVVEDLPPEAESVPIGRPLANSTAYVLREDRSPADIGEEGELWVGGDGVALGYLNRPDLTAERFVPDFFSDRDGDRLYRTGDMARWRTDGVLEFLGRRDRQVKLGSFRVELREVEIVLAAHPTVKEAVVMVAPDGERLHGWVVADPGHDDRQRELPMRLRKYLGDRLPAFMVPARIAVVDTMPLNSSGKVDRGALPEMGGGMELPEAERPRGEHEEAVAYAWQQVLGLPTISRDDNFFDLGGQSLQAAQAVTVLTEHLDLAPEVGSRLIRMLLGNPALTSFAEQLEALRSAPGSAQPRRRIDFEQEAALPAHLRFDAPLACEPTAPQRVLLTGATGFLGVFLLDRLVAAGIPEVWCLVRGDTQEHVLRRIAGRMRRYGLDYESVADRVVPVVGDVTEPRFGLGEEGFDHLARRVDTIVHSGSLINFAYPYETLRRPNVGGAQTVLDLATTHTLKPVHHISTMGTIVGSGTAGVDYVTEDQPLAHGDRVSLGYGESKWVSERMMGHAAERGLPVAVHRPYEITGTRDRGIWNTDTLMCAWFRTIAETGLAPDVELPLDFVPVDYTAEAIVHILRTQQPDGRTYHLTNPHDARLSLLVERLRKMGYPVRTIPYTEWAQKVTELTRKDPQHPMTPYMHMFHDDAAESDITVKEMYFADTFPKFDRSNIEQATRGAGLDLPPVDGRLIDLYLRHFIETGFLTPPAQEGEAA
ncbi:amino acid adenylation domain-containing protein [Streptomyces iconiensis]|uniref:Amino acid adenylation domain-containing protein n=1 Tax=Streptomyces iconiensis TaxID=1384038 RepID=A0ABT7A824_9ACTN|nr:amino acid adenylation domain-containing protein [Streptomyces iconiensis]MDJ1137455.1 amino acid adenylation domain-containing protein [Streptomyces iconiensis]